MRPIRSQLIAAFAVASLAGPALSSALAAGDDWWLEIRHKASSTLVAPVSAERAFVLDPLPRPMGILSPSGKRVVFIGSEPGSDRPFDLFIADVDPTEPSGKANVRRITTDQDRPIDPQWLPGDQGVVFLSGGAADLQVYCVGLEEGSVPVRMSDGRHRSYGLSVTAKGEVAYLVHKGSRKKQQFKDLVVHAPANRRGLAWTERTLLTDQDISSYAFSPDGQVLAWSGLGSLFLVTLETGEARELPLNAVHPQLLNHTAQGMAWRPDGQVLAISCGFLGGISRAFGTPEDEPWPRMFAADKVFFVPTNWIPDAESLKVGQGDAFPSPTADDPQAEISPPAGDQSKPWWVRQVPEWMLELTWIKAEEARQRIIDSQN